MRKIADAVCINPFFAELTCHVPPAVELEVLKIDHARLFVGPFRLLAPPYGSVYLEESRIMGDSTLDVRDHYEREGLDTVIREAPDHITVELEFMYYLVAKQAQATNEGNLQDIQLYQQRQESFMGSHLARWLTAFTERVQKNAQTEFYRTLALLTEMFVQNDLDACASLDTQPMKRSFGFRKRPQDHVGSRRRERPAESDFLGRCLSDRG
jgi:TorA maturation chaperone TorD